MTVQQGRGERERHAEHGHDEVGRGQVDEEPAQVGARSATGREDDYGQHVADHRQSGRRRVQRHQQRLIALRHSVHVSQTLVTRRSAGVDTEVVVPAPAGRDIGRDAVFRSVVVTVSHRPAASRSTVFCRLPKVSDATVPGNRWPRDYSRRLLNRLQAIPLFAQLFALTLSKPTAAFAGKKFRQGNIRRTK